MAQSTVPTADVAPDASDLPAFMRDDEPAPEPYIVATAHLYVLPQTRFEAAVFLDNTGTKVGTNLYLLSGHRRLAAIEFDYGYAPATEVLTSIDHLVDALQDLRRRVLKLAVEPTAAELDEALGPVTGEAVPR